MLHPQVDSEPRSQEQPCDPEVAEKNGVWVIRIIQSKTGCNLGVSHSLPLCCAAQSSLPAWWGVDFQSILEAPAVPFQSSGKECEFAILILRMVLECWIDHTRFDRNSSIWVSSLFIWGSHNISWGSAAASQRVQSAVQCHCCADWPHLAGKC